MTVDSKPGAEALDQIAQRGREIAASMGEFSEIISRRAADAWRDSAPARREAAKAAQHAGHEAAAWSRLAWREQLQPGLRGLWQRRTTLVGLGATLPVARDAALRKMSSAAAEPRRRSGRWGALLLGLVAGAVAGAVAALLATPKAGRQVREELAVVARDAADRARVTARETAQRARTLAGSASDWMPIFQREPIDQPETVPPVEVTPPAPVAPTPARRRASAERPVVSEDEAGA
ncbi:MAG TPA: YtxH domain-containing protein [Candidatus Limnocylindria bacterium]|nr:YtxH domain-containing protein [Candidatus Limnocylindria bacterium]